MKNIVKSITATAVLSVSVMSSVSAKDDMYVGIQSSWPSYGLSVKKDLNNDWAVQGVLGALGTVSQFSARGIYKFKKKKNYNVYGYGAIGMWTWDSDIRGIDDESVVGFGIGTGLEYDLREWMGNDMPLFWSIELGANIVSFDNYNDFASFGIGGGLHYKF